MCNREGELGPPHAAEQDGCTGPGASSAAHRIKHEPFCSYHAAARSVKQETDIGASCQCRPLEPQLEPVKREVSQFKHETHDACDDIGSVDATQAVKIEIEINPAAYEPNIKTESHSIEDKPTSLPASKGDDSEGVENLKAVHAKRHISRQAVKQIPDQIRYDSSLWHFPIEMYDDEDLKQTYEPSENGHIPTRPNKRKSKDPSGRKETSKRRCFRKRYYCTKDILVADKTNTTNKLTPQRTAMSGGPYQCYICQKSVTTKKAFDKHVDAQACRDVYQCHMRVKVFKRKGGLYNHILTHTLPWTFKCNVCTESFARQWDLQNHSSLHIGQREFQCDICKKYFRTKNSIYNHMEKHLSYRKHPCALCQKGFKRNKDLKKHITIHTNERSFECDICKKVFKSKSHLY